jgi:hypothetical protein
VFAGQNRGNARISYTQLISSNNAMIRVRANDGFHETVAVSKEFVVIGSGPKVRITDPLPARQSLRNVQGINNTLIIPGRKNTTVKLFNGETHEFRGIAYNETLQPISDEGLEWYIDETKIGTGNNVTVKTLPVGSHVLRLVAVDKVGRTSEDSIAIEVKQSIPRFLTLTAPTIISTDSLEVIIQASTSVPCILKAAGKTFNLNRRLQHIKLPISPRTTQLELLLKAGDELSVRILRFRRIN